MLLKQTSACGPVLLSTEVFLDVNMVHFGGEAVCAAGVKCNVMMCVGVYRL